MVDRSATELAIKRDRIEGVWSEGPWSSEETRRMVLRNVARCNYKGGDEVAQGLFYQRAGKTSSDGGMVN